jgi:solute carrier family 25 phosphate transporter 23/24/25/41
VSRTATAPFDRLKIYLITHVDTPSELRNPMHLVKGDVTAVAKESLKIGKLGFQHLGDAVRTIYVQGGGIRAFWVGNGLNVTKIFPVGRGDCRLHSLNELTSAL